MTESTAVTSAGATVAGLSTPSVADERARLAAEAAAKDPAKLSVAELEAQITAARRRLAGTVDEIADRVNPKNVAARTSEKAKERATAAAGDAKVKVSAFFHTPSGELDTTKVGAVGGAVVLVILIKIIARVRTRRH